MIKRYRFRKNIYRISSFLFVAVILFLALFVRVSAKNGDIHTVTVSPMTGSYIYKLYAYYNTPAENADYNISKSFDFGTFEVGRKYSIKFYLKTEVSIATTGGLAFSYGPTSYFNGTERISALGVSSTVSYGWNTYVFQPTVSRPAFTYTGTIRTVGSTSVSTDSNNKTFAYAQPSYKISITDVTITDITPLTTDERLEIIQDNTTELNNKVDNLTNGYDSTAGNAAGDQLSNNFSQVDAAEGNTVADAKESLGKFDFMDSVKFTAGLISGLSYLYSFSNAFFLASGNFSVVVTAVYCLSFITILVGLWRFFRGS